MHPLKHPVFRRLFTAQLLSLAGIGIMTVGLSLKAYALGGATGAGLILGTLFALKMVVYVGFAPFAEAMLAHRTPRGVLIALDVFRTVLLLAMTLADSIAPLIVTTVLFYAASSAFTPLYQSLIPTVLPDEETYTSALVLSRLAYTAESMLSPLFAAAALTLVAATALFVLAAVCLLGSVVALSVSGLSSQASLPLKRPFRERLGRGLRIYFRTPRLRGLFAVNLALSFSLSWVLVNSVVYAGLRLDDSHAYPWLMAAYGAGAAAAALSVPHWLKHTNERRLMLFGGLAFAALTPLILLPSLPLPLLLGLWAGFGATSSLVLTPGGLVLTRSAAAADRPAVFAAQFSMSHAGWLLAYPVAGWLGSRLAPEHALVALGGVCAALTLVAARVWPHSDPLVREHEHPELAPDHPHLGEHRIDGNSGSHAHAYRIDDLHPDWVR